MQDDYADEVESIEDHYDDNDDDYLVDLDRSTLSAARLVPGGSRPGTSSNLSYIQEIERQNEMLNTRLNTTQTIPKRVV